MAFNLTFSLGRLLGRNEKITTAKLNAVVKGISASFSGTVGHADINAGAIKADLVTPDAYDYVGASLSGGTYSGTWSPAPAGYTDGLWLAFKADTANTAAVNLNANGLGAKPIRKWAGQALEAGDILANQIVTVRYNSTIVGGGCFEVASLLGQPWPDGYRLGTSVFDAVSSYVITVPDRVRAYGGGLTIAFYADAANLGATTVNVNALGVKSLYANRNGTALQAGQIVTNQLVVAVYDGHGGFQVVSPLAGVYTPAEAVVGASRNLVAQPNAGAATSKVDVTADELVLKDVNGKTYLASSVSVTADVTVSQNLNGRDTATAEAASTWYYVWVISDGTTVASVLSASSAAATVETNLRASANFAGYSYKALVGQVRNDGSSNFVTFYQQAREVWLNETQVFDSKTGVTSFTALSGGDLTTFQGLVPPNAKTARGSCGTVGSSRGMAVAADGNGLGESLSVGGATAATVDGYEQAGVWVCPLKTAQTVYYKMQDTTASAYRLSASGYTF